MKNVSLAIVVACGALTLTACEPATAQQPLVAHIVQNHDLVTKPLAIMDSWKGGIVRVKVDRPGGNLPATWSLTVVSPARKPLTLESNALGAFLIDGDPATTVTLDLPLTSSESVFARGNPPDIRVRVIRVLAHSSIEPEQIISTCPRIDFFNGDVGSAERSWGLSFAQVDLIGADPDDVRYCTGIKIAAKHWLTAAHCIAADPAGAHSAVKRIRVQPYDYRNGDISEVPQWAKAIASGQKDGKPDNSQVLKPGDLDYAVLETEGEFGNAPVFAMTYNSNLATGEALQLFQHWTGALKPTPGGKARSSDDTCVVMGFGPDDPGADPELCPLQVWHGCSSEPGASGGAVVKRQSLDLVAVHLGAGLTKKFNCAVSIASVRKHLCMNHPSFAKEITKCD